MEASKISIPASIPADAATGKKTKHLPSEEGVWVFIMGDMTVFALFFSVFVYYRNADVALFAASSAKLNMHYGAINTLLLLASSWFVVLAVSAVRKGLPHLAPKLFGAALACGISFGVVKFFEYGEKIRDGITLTTNDFFMYYFVFTGIHFLHVLIGLGVLSFTIAHCRKHQTGKISMPLVEGSACFWHMVDLLWIVLFPLLYLLR